MLSITYYGAFFAGLLSFFSPCILPMVPFYISYMTGISVKNLRDGDLGHDFIKRQLLVQSVAFAAGVITVFMLLGLGATVLGRIFLDWREGLSYVAAGLLVLFGLHFMGIFRISFLNQSAQVQLDVSPRTLIGAYLMGLAFGFGWTPCVGPILTAILIMAAGLEHQWQGAALLLVYGVGMTLPFVITPLMMGPFLAWAARNRSILRFVEKAMGAFLVMFGMMIATGAVGMVADWLILNFNWSTFLI